MIQAEEGLYQYVEIINNIIELATEIQNKLNDGVKGYVFSANTQDNYLKKEYKRLKDYINSLDFETIKVVQTIMYIGKDGFEEVEGKCDYYKCRKKMDDNWNDNKTIEANQISNKGGVLAEFLVNGCKKIGLLI